MQQLCQICFSRRCMDYICIPDWRVICRWCYVIEEAAIHMSFVLRYRVLELLFEVIAWCSVRFFGSFYACAGIFMLLVLILCLIVKRCLFCLIRNCTIYSPYALFQSASAQRSLFDGRTRQSPHKLCFYVGGLNFSENPWHFYHGLARPVHHSDAKS